MYMYRLPVAALALVGALMSPTMGAAAAPNLAGVSGLIKTPTAAVLEDGHLVGGFSWVGGSRAFLRNWVDGSAPIADRMYYATMGLLPGLELSLDMLQVVGLIDPDAPGAAYAIHRVSNIKYQLPLSAAWPRLALGAQDPLSANAVTRGPEGQTNYGLTTFYAVATQPFGPFHLHLGYAQGTDYMRGVFGGADYDLLGGLNLRAEYDSQFLNAGLQWRPVSVLSLYMARLFPGDWGYGLTFDWRL